MSSTTRILRFENLVASGDQAPIVVRLMMVANDLLVANEAQEHFANDNNRDRRHRVMGAGLYCLRLQLSHLKEGLKVIENVRDHDSLSRVVVACHPDVTAAFERLAENLRGGANYTRFEQIVGRIRHNLTFHYDESSAMVSRSLVDLSRPNRRQAAPITLGSDAYSCRFELADVVTDNIISRQIWCIPDDANLREEANIIARETHAIFLDYLAFAGGFIWKWCEGR